MNLKTPSFDKNSYFWDSKKFAKWLQIPYNIESNINLSDFEVVFNVSFLLDGVPVRFDRLVYLVRSYVS